MAKKALDQKLITKKDQTKIVTAAKNGYVASWTAVWTIPAVVKDCDAGPTCVQVNLQGVIDSFVAKSNELRQIANTLATKVKSKGGKKLADYIVKHAKALHEKNVAESKLLPTSTTECV
jgi:hypothetical protein